MCNIQGDLLVSVHLPRQKYSELEIIVKTDPFVTIHKLKWILQDTIAYPCHCPLFTDV
jgi:hypothetical protein